MNDEKNISNLNGEMTEVPSVLIGIEMEEEAKTNKKQQANEYPDTKAPPQYSNALSVAPIPAASDCHQPHFNQQQNIDALNEQRNFSAAADGQPQQKIYSIPLAITTNAAEVLNAGAAGATVGKMPSKLEQLNVVYTMPTSSPMQSKQQFEVPPQQQQSMQIINMTNMVAGGANCVHKFENAANGCNALCICLLVIFLFPIGLIFLLCIPFAMKKRCTKCGLAFQC